MRGTEIVTLSLTIDRPVKCNRISIRNQIEIFTAEVEKLEPAKKLLFLLYFRYGHSQSDIAKLLKIDPGNVSRRLRKIATILEDKLSAHKEADNQVG